MRSRIRDFFRRVLPPAVFIALRQIWQLRPSWRAEREKAARIHRSVGSVVHTGPFAGMKYLRMSSGSRLYPKIIGSYEAELQPHIERIISERSFEKIVDVGAAEGYYAVGLARRQPQADVLAYDIDSVSRWACAKLAALNDVSIAIGGECTPEILNAVGGGNSLLICDCEGSELQLLDPDLAPSLFATTMIVEVHEHLAPGVSDVLLERFGRSHRIHWVTETRKNPDDYGVLSALPRQDRLEAVDEQRTRGMRWAVMEPLM